MGNSGDKMENIIIIGAGPAGISAALYAARGNLTPTVAQQWNRSTGKSRKKLKIIMAWNDHSQEKNFMREELHRQRLWAFA